MSLFDRKIVDFIWRGVLDIGKVGILNHFWNQGGGGDERGYRNMYKNELGLVL
jgi:hypothetical protein